MSRPQAAWRRRFDAWLPSWAATRGVYYGWLIVAALSVTQMTGWGILYYAPSVMLLPMEAELGWTRAELSAGLSIAWLVQAFCSVPFGRWLDRRGPRLLMTGASVLAPLALLAWAYVSEKAWYWVLHAVLGMTMAGLLYEPAFAATAVWFTTQRGRAFATITLFGGLASTLFLPLTTSLLERFGWRLGLMALALILLVVTLPLHALVLRRRPLDLELAPDGEAASAEKTAALPLPRQIPAEHALRSPAFFYFTSAVASASFGGALVAIHILPFLREGGASGALAAWSIGLVGFMQLPGRISFPWLAARIPAAWLGPAVFLSQAIAMICLASSQQTAAILLFAVLYGFGNGVATLLRASRPAELFGVAAYGTLSGVISFASTLCRAASPFVVGWLYLRTQDYRPLLWGTAGLLLAGAACAYLAEITPTEKVPRA